MQAMWEMSIMSQRGHEAAAIRALSLLLVLLVSTVGGAGTADALFPVPQGGKWGFIDRSGRLVVPARFDRLGGCIRRVFDVDLAPVVLDGQWVYIDRAGKVVVRVPGKASGGSGWRHRRPRAEPAGPEVHHCGPFSGGLAVIGVGTIRMGDVGRITYGFIDRTGRTVIEPTFSGAREFSEGFAAVRLRPRWAYVDRKGKALIKDLGYAYDFEGGRALVRLDRDGRGRWGMIDKTGRMVMTFGQMELCRPFSEDRAAFRRGGTWGYLDPAGKEVVPPKFTIVEPFSDGVALVWIGRSGVDAGGMAAKVRVIDKAGRFVTDRTFTSAYSFRERLAPVCTGARWGYVNTKGRLAIPDRFGSAAQFSDGLAAVKVDGKYVYINKTGKVVIEPRPVLTFGGPFIRGLARAHFGSRIGYLNKAGRIVHNWEKPKPPTRREG